MSHSVRKHLRLEIDSYDATIRRFIPAYDEMVQAAVEAVAAGSPAHVLDLGAGTGALAGAFLARTERGGSSGDADGARVPETEATSRAPLVELIDIDPEMLGQARQRLKPFGARARYTLHSFEDRLPACDAVMASLSLHHVPTLEAKTALFGRVFDALRSGGVLVNADVTMPATDPGRSAAFEAWASHLVANGITREEAFEHFDAWSGEDTYFPLEEELTALEVVGFRAECIWRTGVSAVVVGRKA